MGSLKIFDGTEYKPVGVTINQNITQVNGIEMVKLWENASPTSAFLGRVALDLSSFTHFSIEFEVYNQQPRYESTGILKKETGKTFQLSGVAPYTSDERPTWIFRTFSVSDDGFVFQEGRYWANSVTQTHGATNNVCYPIRIYGIKGVK